MLLTITGQNFASDFIDLGLTYSAALPTQLGGVQVLFDGIAAEMFQVAPDHVICVVPPMNGKDSVTVQVVGGSQSATRFILRVSYGSTGYLTKLFPALPGAGSVDGNIPNSGGTANDADHPAAPGSVVTLFATGISRKGPVSLFWNAPPLQEPHSVVSALLGNAFQAPGLIHAMYAVRFLIPDAPGPGVYAVPVPGVLTSFEIGYVGSELGAYVK